MFLASTPTDERISDFLQAQKDEPFSYDEVGASRAGSPVVPGYVVDHNRVKLGSGEETFSRAVRSLWDWRMFDLGWVETKPPGSTVEVGETVAMLGNHYGFSSLNPCRIVYRIEDDGELRRSGFAYGTLPAHAARGEERFTVEWDRKDDAVWYDLYAFSRPNHLLAKVGKPFVRSLQRRFARESLRAMFQTVRLL